MRPASNPLKPFMPPPPTFTGLGTVPLKTLLTRNVANVMTPSFFTAATCPLKITSARATEGSGKGFAQEVADAARVKVAMTPNDNTARKMAAARRPLARLIGEG